MSDNSPSTKLEKVSGNDTLALEEALTIADYTYTQEVNAAVKKRKEGGSLEDFKRDVVFARLRFALRKSTIQESTSDSKESDEMLARMKADMKCITKTKDE